MVLYYSKMLTSSYMAWLDFLPVQLAIFNIVSVCFPDTHLLSISGDHRIANVYVFLGRVKLRLMFMGLVSGFEGLS